MNTPQGRTKRKVKITAETVPFRKSNRKEVIRRKTKNTLRETSKSNISNKRSKAIPKNKATKLTETGENIHKTTRKKRTCICKLCKERFDNVFDLANHRESHQHSIDKQECPICQKSVDSTVKLSDHMKTHTPHKTIDKTKLFQCNICQVEQFTEIQSLESHVHGHFDEDSYECRLCPQKQFWELSVLLKHFETSHIDSTFIYVCRYCKQEFTIEKDFIDHDRLHKIEVTSFNCTNCGETFQSSAALGEHRRFHGKPYNCKQCCRGFNRSEDLYNHMRIHKGLPVFECRLCERMFAQSKSFSSHVQRVHRDAFLPHELSLVAIVVETNLKKIQTSYSDNRSKDALDDHEKIGKIYNFDVVELVKGSLRKSPPPLTHIDKPFVEIVTESAVKQDVWGEASQERSSSFPLKPRIFTKTGTIETSLIRKYKCPWCHLIFVKMKTVEIHCIRNHDGKYEIDQLIEIKMNVENNECIEMSTLSNDNISEPNLSSTISLKLSCFSCDKVFATRPEQIDHLKSEHGGLNPFKCVECGLSFDASKALFDHAQTHLETRKKCKYCGMTFMQQHSLAKHIKRHEGPNIKQCTVCAVPFREEKDLQKHLRTHAEGKPHKCDFCDKRFAQSCDKIKHIRIHTGERPYACKICGKTFAHLTSIKKHEYVHTGERSHQCTVCGKSFQHNSNLVVHMRVHTGERPYKCTVCDRAFYASGHFADHMRMHSGIKNFKCELCDKSFLHQSSFHKHKKTHSGEKPHHCMLCDRRFSQPGHFKEHMRIHTGEKPYACPVCTKTFRRLDSMQKHLKTHSSKRNIGIDGNNKMNIVHASSIPPPASIQYTFDNPTENTNVTNQIGGMTEVTQFHSINQIQLIDSAITLQESHQPESQQLQDVQSQIGSVQLHEFVKIEQVRLLNVSDSSTIALVEPNQTNGFNTFSYNIEL